MIATLDRTASLRAILGVFLDAVKEGGDHGAPGGVMYAAMMDRISLNQFEQIMAALVQLGCVRQSGNLFFYVRGLP